MHCPSAVVLICASLPFLSAAPGFSDVLPISVKDGQLLFGGEPGSISGNSLFWSNDGWGGEKFYNAKLVEWLKKDWNSKVIRAAMGVEEGGGWLYSPESNLNRVKVVVDAAIENGMYVIIDFHSHNAHRYQKEAIEFFTEMAKLYGEYNNVIYELWNEPRTDVTWNGDVKPYALAVIEAIRAVDPDNLIVIGSTTWSQDVDIAANDPITGHDNIAYSLHFYAGTHGQNLRDKASNALSKKVALFATEWGSVNADGNGAVARQESDAWKAFLKANKISNANWSVNDKMEGASVVKPGANPEGGWSDSDLTESGKYTRELVRNWNL